MKQSKSSRYALSEFGMLVRDVVQQLVDFPEDVEIRELIGDRLTVLEVAVRQSDHGKVVGRAAANVEALRQVANCVGGKDGRRYRIEVLEDPLDPSTRHPLSTHPSLTDDTVAVTTALLGRLVQALVDEPKAVEIAPVEGIATAVFEVRVGVSDVARVLGRRGVTANALRRLLFSMGAREGRRFILEILEDER